MVKRDGEGEGKFSSMKIICENGRKKKKKCCRLHIRNDNPKGLYRNRCD